MQLNKVCCVAVLVTPSFNLLSMKSTQLLLPLLTSLGLVAGQATGQALPPPEDLPEERLRTEIILEARSPLNGEPLSPAEYEELQAQLVDYPAPTLDSQIREIVFLLQIRRVLRPIVPFLPSRVEKIPLYIVSINFRYKVLLICFA